ncbi:signal peptidase I [Agathobacter ruminis]|uniref:Signal peptidase I n=1 Tax=Agathobacter ruminis TaxID=1712665 RepID=A0A2G3E183_9FIRM|nr:signal peptidase I [Agathobacter ruminis]MDC7302727.1 signal peptidase I [Agathobacter ruminis]PHU37032.1 signal peptidase I [Agathobacter ruminis]
MRRRRKSGLNFGKQRKKFNMGLFKEIMSWVVELLAVMLVAMLLVYLFCYRTKVVGNAMEPSLLNGEDVFVNRFSYTFTKPKAGDVIVFLPNGNEKSHYYVRRVVGTPGDTIQIRDGAVYINNQFYEEETEVASIENAGIAAEPIELGTDEYFVLGDNRNNSEDSRYANIGVIKKSYIEGKAWYRFSSLGNMGFVR